MYYKKLLLAATKWKCIQPCQVQRLFHASVGHQETKNNIIANLNN